MTIGQITRDHVLQAIAEYDALGPDGFHGKYGYGEARLYTFTYEGKDYPAKGVIGAAHVLGLGSRLDNLSGGARVNRQLESLGFLVESKLDPEFVSTGFWWVNQGQNFDAERQGGFVWAGIHSKSGAVLGHHENVSRLEPGDVILHNAAGTIRAVGTVLSSVSETPNPHLAPEDEPEMGYEAKVQYFDLAQPIPRDEIPLWLRREEQGAFDKDGQPTQGYMRPLSEAFVEALEDLFASRWPEESPMVPRDQSVWLFQANPSIYDLDDVLREAHLGTVGDWSVTRYAEQMREGDIAAFWVGGEHAGIRALGRITGEPHVRRPAFDTNRDQDTAIPYRYTLILNQPLYKIDLQENPTLKNLSVIRAPQGTNFKVSDDEWYAIRDLALEASRSIQGPEARATHLLFKWSADFEPRTIDLHRAVADAKGSVWWGKFGKPGGRGLRHKRLTEIRHQISHGIDTYAFLYRAGEVWRTKIEDITADPDSVDADRLPSYYSTDQCVLFVRVSEFEGLDPKWATENLVLASDPDPGRMPGALGNQTSPLLVHVLESAIEPAPQLTIKWLETRTLWSREQLEELIDALTSPRGAQVVLAGPPGTGKTWVAKHVVRFLTQDRPLSHRVVQFHPSYGYEEFIEGLRPVVADSGAIQFERKDGVVLELVGQMEEGDDLYFIVIDEMNRANLPRVFGELLYLFEYRGEEEAIDLQYSREFSLPANLRFIGTMNTADRSIRSIDTALRRRFEVIECFPDTEILSRYFATRTNHVPDLVDGFKRLNSRLSEALGRHHTIGHTFLMKDPMTISALRRVWRRQIKPLVEEYFFDQPDQADLFVLEELWPSTSYELPTTPGGEADVTERPSGPSPNATEATTRAGDRGPGDSEPI